MPPTPALGGADLVAQEIGEGTSGEGDANRFFIGEVLFRDQICPAEHPPWKTVRTRSASSSSTKSFLSRLT
jgi:hypothetical protein